MNKNGGINPQSQEDLIKAKEVDLITLPKDIKGTNCFNCKFNKIVDTENRIGYCTNPKVKQLVNERMCCALWDNKGVERPWK